MRKITLGIFILAFSLYASLLTAQSSTPESTGYDGDNFSLEGALALLKVSDSPEDFEKRINQEDNDVNNLDLNNDGEIDYIRIEDKQGDDTHALILQVAIDEQESQDIAVIEIEKTGDQKATLQIIGDEDIFGDQKIIEPYEAYKSDKGQKALERQPQMGVIVNVWFWPSIRFIYAPVYHPYISPWRYRVYPRWYRPWRPRPFAVFAPRTVHYRTHFRPTPIHRVVRAHAVYRPHRHSSVVVHQRTTTVRATKHGKGKVVTTKTTTVGKKGHNTAIKHSKTTTKVGKKGNKVGVKKTKTSTKVSKKGKRTKVKRTKTKTVRKKRRH